MIYLKHKFRQINLQQLKKIGFIGLDDKKLSTSFYDEVKTFFSNSEVCWVSGNEGRSTFDAVVVLFNGKWYKELRKTFGSVRWASIIADKYIVLYEIQERKIKLLTGKTLMRWYISLFAERAGTEFLKRYQNVSKKN